MGISVHTAERIGRYTVLGMQTFQILLLWISLTKRLPRLIIQYSKLFLAIPHCRSQLLLSYFLGSSLLGTLLNRHLKPFIPSPSLILPLLRSSLARSFLLYSLKFRLYLSSCHNLPLGFFLARHTASPYNSYLQSQSSLILQMCDIETIRYLRNRFLFFLSNLRT